MFARKVGRNEINNIGEETKGQLNVDEHRGHQAAEKEIKNNAMLYEFEKKQQGVTRKPSDDELELKSSDAVPNHASRRTTITLNAAGGAPLNKDDQKDDSIDELNESSMMDEEEKK